MFFIGSRTIDDWSLPYIIERERRPNGEYERRHWRGWRRLFLWPIWRRIALSGSAPTPAPPWP